MTPNTPAGQYPMIQQPKTNKVPEVQIWIQKYRAKKKRSSKKQWILLPHLPSSDISEFFSKNFQIK